MPDLIDVLIEAQSDLDWCTDPSELERALNCVSSWSGIPPGNYRVLPDGHDFDCRGGLPGPMLPD